MDHIYEDIIKLQGVVIKKAVPTMWSGPLHVPYDNFITAVDQYSNYK